MVKQIKTTGRIFVLTAVMIVLALLAASAGYAAEIETAAGAETETGSGTNSAHKCVLKKDAFFLVRDAFENPGEFGTITLNQEETAKLDDSVTENEQCIYGTVGGSIVINVTPKDGYRLCSIRTRSNLLQLTQLTEGCYLVSNLWDDEYIIANFEEVERQHHIKVVNRNRGDVALSGNTYQFLPNEGSYLADVLVNGESQGSITQWTIREGDEIVVRFAKNGETWRETEALDNSRNRPLYEKVVKGIKKSTIKASTVKVSGKKIRLKWSKSSGYKVTYFEIYRSTSKKTLGTGKPVCKTDSGSTKVYDDTKSLKKGIRYYYKVRGVRVVNGMKFYTQWSNVACRIAK